MSPWRYAVKPGMLLVCLVVAASQVAVAQSGPGAGANIDLQAFRPAIDSKGYVTVNSPEPLRHGELSFGLVTNWGKGLLRFEDDDRHYEVEHVISPTLVAAVGVRLAGLAFEVAVAAPFAVMIGDRGPDDNGGTPSNPNDDERFAFDGQGFGDLAVHFKTRLLRQRQAGLSAAVLASVTLPTATKSHAWMGSETLTLQVGVAVERTFDRLRLAGNASFLYRPDGESEFRDSGGSSLPFTGGIVRVGSSLPYGVAAAYSISRHRFELVGEVFGALPIASENYLPLEALAGAKLYLAKSSFLTFGAGLGLARHQAANPDARAFVGIVFEPRVRETSPVPQASLNEEEDEPEDDGPSDRDGDRIIDTEDACPDEPEDFDEFEDLDGCPDYDNDRDRILDVDDLCPNEPEDYDGFEDADGCPEIDNDRDRILDTDDQCPGKDGQPRRDTAEVYNGKDDDDGCPDGRIRMGETIIHILDKIHFEYDSATIRPESFPILDEIATTILMNERIRRVEVQGHSDERGSERYNNQLSQRRAESVVAYLRRFGVESERLLARGYGETVPKESAHNQRAWAANRRVEFHIVDQRGE